MIARNDDSGAGHFTPKKFTWWCTRKEQPPKTYHSVLSHVTIELPETDALYSDAECGGEETVSGLPAVSMRQMLR